MPSPITVIHWESLGCPPASTTIDFYVVLKPHHENALIDVLYEVSDPRHPKYIHSYTPPLPPVLTIAVALFQIRWTPVKGADC